MTRTGVIAVTGGALCAALVACNPQPLHCNVDADCASSRCVLGTCGDPLEGGVEDHLGDGPPPIDGDDPIGGEGEGEGEQPSPEEPPEDAGCPALTTAYYDDDHDGFTGRSALVCVDEPLAPHAFLTPQRAPIHLVEPDTVDVLAGAWDESGRDFFRETGSATGEIVLGGFACASSVEEVAGLEVILTLDSAATPDGGNGTPLEVRAAAVLAYGAEDCDDDDRDAFSPAELRVDADLDGFAGGLRLRRAWASPCPPTAASATSTARPTIPPPSPARPSASRASASAWVASTSTATAATSSSPRAWRT
jgi:hypothetical protein